VERNLIFLSAGPVLNKYWIVKIPVLESYLIYEIDNRTVITSCNGIVFSLFFLLEQTIEKG
jgi:hypothetical protein